MNTPADPRPIPPEKPLPMDCCGSGCPRCVSEIYEDELAYYASELAAWEARQQAHSVAGGDG